MLHPSVGHVPVEALLIEGSRSASGPPSVASSPPPDRRTPTITSVTAFFDRALSWEQEKQAVGAHSLEETAPFRAGVGPARLIVAECHGEAAPG